MKELKSTIFPDDQSRLLWACRRGMLELDVLLTNFLKEAYPALSIENKQLFIELLNCSDPELFQWLMGREIPSDVNLAKITEEIRHHARSRIYIKTV
jgi:antitoxin CptB